MKDNNGRKRKLEGDNNSKEDIGIVYDEVYVQFLVNRSLRAQPPSCRVYSTTFGLYTTPVPRCKVDLLCYIQYLQMYVCIYMYICWYEKKGLRSVYIYTVVCINKCETCI